MPAPSPPPSENFFRGIAKPTPSQCHYCRHPTLTVRTISVWAQPRLDLDCRINQYAPLVTWNCPSFEREPGADDETIVWNPHEYPEWEEQRRERHRLHALGNVIPWPWCSVDVLNTLPVRGQC